MKPRLAFVLPVLVLFALAPASRAQFATGFELSDGYAADTNLTWPTGFVDPVLDNGAAWAAYGSLSGGGSIRSYLGTNAVRLLDNGGGGFSTGLDLAGAIDFAQAFTFSFDLAIESADPGSATGGTPFVNVRLGVGTNSNSNKSWLRFSYNVDGSLTLWSKTNSGASGTTQIGVGNLSDFVSAGQWLSVSIAIDPVTMTYAGLTLSGDKKTETITSIVGAWLPWGGDTAGTSTSVLWLGSTGAPTSTSYVDNVSLANIPEPSAAALLVGLGGLSLAALRRRKR